MLIDAAAYAGICAEVLVVAPTFEGWRLVEQTLTAPGWGQPAFRVRDVHKDRVGPGRQFAPPAEGSKYSLQSVLNEFKEKIVELGGTPEAIRLLDQFIGFDTKEKKIMAEKLNKKAPPKKADAKGASKSKGNVDALRKAREARAANAGPDNRKISIIKKPHGAREGTARAGILDSIYKAKTVQQAVDSGVKKNDVTWAAREGYISIG